MAIPAPQAVVGDLPTAPPLPNLPSADSVLGQVPGVSVGKRGGLPSLPRFARGRPPRPLGARPSRPAAAPAAQTVVKVQQAPAAAPLAPVNSGPKPGTEIPHGLGEQAPTEPSAADNLKGLAHNLLSRVRAPKRKEIHEKVIAAQRGPDVNSAYQKMETGQPLSATEFDLIEKHQEATAQFGKGIRGKPKPEETRKILESSPPPETPTP